MTDIDQLTARRVLDLRLPDNDAMADTVGGYLIELLATLWREEQSFSGKRPFGNSGWQYDLYVPLVKAGLISGELDEDGYPVEVDYKAGDRLIQAAIGELGRAGCG